MTFSVVARCAETGQLGVAVSTAVPAVGALCPYAAAGVGAASTQSWVNPYLGSRAVSLLAEGVSAQEAVDQVVSADPDASSRQLGVVDARGRSAAFTGSDCTGWAGHRVGEGWSIQGNMLVGEATVVAMADAISSDGPLVQRLMVALQAGQDAGGDARGRQSAALLVVDVEDYPLIDLRIDDDPDPVPALARLLAVAETQLIPFIRSMPRRDGTSPPQDSTLTASLLQSLDGRDSSSR